MFEKGLPGGAMAVLDRYVLIFLILLAGTALLCPGYAEAERKPDGSDEVWQGSFADGSLLTWERLDEMLDAHKKWLALAKEWMDVDLTKTGVEEYDWEVWPPIMAEGRFVLPEAVLTGVNLAGAVLAGADLQETVIPGANLQGADLRYANLKHALLDNTNLQETYLHHANLQGADLRGTSLKGAQLTAADLTQASLNDADLTEADLVYTNLYGAYLLNANMKGALYEPKPGGMPDIAATGTARNLETMRFRDFPNGLVALRRAFKDHGYRRQEREINYALKRSQWENNWNRVTQSPADFNLGNWLEAVFNYAAFDLTVRYGLEPGRALKALGLLILLFTIPYTVAFAAIVKADGIWRYWDPERLRPHIGTDEPELMTVRGWRAVAWGFWFSVLSAFHFGWRELNVGNWLARIQPRAYALRPSGWVRTVSGIQSLLSVYLLALWALTYFGNPFEY